MITWVLYKPCTIAKHRKVKYSLKFIERFSWCPSVENEGLDMIQTLCKETHVQVYIATKWYKLAKICLVRVEEKGYHFNYKQHMESIYTLPVCKKQYKFEVCMASNSHEHP